jgi:hypothetical protein
MRSGFILPGGNDNEQLELALIAEDAGWDGVFVWEGAYGVDAWRHLSAIAARSHRVRPRHDAHPAAVAAPLEGRQPGRDPRSSLRRPTAPHGRARRAHRRSPADGREEDLRVRASMIDDGIDLIRALWEGRAEFGGQAFRYRFEATDQLEVGRPVQERLPIWVVGLWPRIKSMRRVLRCDGIAPQFEGEHRTRPIAFARCGPGWRRTGPGPTSTCWPRGARRTANASEASRIVGPWGDAGCTWWMESTGRCPTTRRGGWRRSAGAWWRAHRRSDADRSGRVNVGGEGFGPGVVSVAGSSDRACRATAIRAARAEPRPQPAIALRHCSGENHSHVIRLSVARDTHLSTGFSSSGCAGRRHSDKESSGTTSGSRFPSAFPLEARNRRG